MKNAPSDQTKSILYSNNTSSNTQCLQILTHLRCSAKNTLELHKLGHMSPASRISELRSKGFVITTTLESVLDEHGKSHKGVARYTLVSELSINNPYIEVAA